VKQAAHRVIRERPASKLRMTPTPSSSFFLLWRRPLIVAAHRRYLAKAAA